MTRHVTSFAIDDKPAFQQYVPNPGDLGNGVEIGRDEPVLGQSHPLIVFRHPSRNDDSRTMISDSSTTRDTFTRFDIIRVATLMNFSHYLAS
jgi:hypothetical protein